MSDSAFFLSSDFDMLKTFLFTRMPFRKRRIEAMSLPQIRTSISKSSMLSPYYSSSMKAFVLMLKL